jgi:hypothetical protein
MTILLCWDVWIYEVDSAVAILIRNGRSARQEGRKSVNTFFQSNVRFLYLIRYCRFAILSYPCPFSENRIGLCDYMMPLKKDQRHLRRSCYSKAAEQHK